MMDTPTPVLVWQALCVSTLVGGSHKGLFYALMVKRLLLTCFRKAV